MGPAQAMEAVRKALSMGAAKGVLVSDVVRCLFTSVDPAADCQAEIQACQAE